MWIRVKLVALAMCSHQVTGKFRKGIVVYRVHLPGAFSCNVAETAHNHGHLIEPRILHSNMHFLYGKTDFGSRSGPQASAQRLGA